jgi:YidC/Oxa1 family membrane protein insertase
MDRKTIIILVLSVGLLMAWGPLINHLYPPKPLTGTSRSGATNQPGTNAAALEVGPTNPVTVAPAVVGPPTDFVRPSTKEVEVLLENDYARYTFTSHGGGLKLVELKKYPEAVGRGSRRSEATMKLASLNKHAPIPVLTLIGGDALQGDGFWQLRTNAAGVEAEKAFPSGLRVVKTFQLSTNYLVMVNVRLENHSAQPLQLPGHQLVIGTATPMSANDNPTLLGFMWYDGTRSEQIGEAWFANRTLGCFAGTPRGLYANNTGKVVWAAVHNQFFTTVVIPKEPAPGVSSLRINLPYEDFGATPLNPGKGPQPVGYQTALVYPEITLEPGKSLEQGFQVFAGPKAYKILARLSNDCDLVMGFGGFFGFFAKLLLLSMNGLHDALGLSYALTIIAITVIIKLLFWPLTRASTRSMKRMAKLQPQMKALQEKYKDDPKKMNQKLMEFMKEHKVSPLGGCLPMLVQIPFFFGFYRMLQSAIELRGAQFLWAPDLSQPDTVWHIPGPDFPVNPLPLVMGATMLWQARLTPPSPGMDPVQQKIMKYMPMMFMVFLYNFSAGLTLYWTVQNLLTIAQMKLTRSSDDQSGSPGGKPPLPAKPAAPLRKSK